MILDYATLTVGGALVALICGFLLIAAWTQYDDSRIAVSFGASHILGGGAIALLALAELHAAVPVALAQPAFVLAALLVLFGVLAFDGRRISLGLWGAAIAAVVLSFVVSHLDPDRGHARILQLSIVTATFAAAATMLRLKRDGLRARVPLAALLMLHAVMNAVGLAEAILQDAIPSGIASFSNWYGAVHVESMIYFIGTTLFVVTLLKERSESGHQVASLTDPLTGLPNRRAFLAASERMLARRQRTSAPLSVLAIDLDRFKGVNDTFGHAVGDKVLMVFAAVAKEHLRPDDIVARFGGEEFAVLLPEANARQGCEIAERLRSSFAAAASRVDGHDVGATFSTGLTLIVGAEASISDALEEADAALYRAKLNGRNRIEIASREQRMRLVI
ncbi:GGDEF domain-containing protein [Acuticoccus sp. M5D2P5]|uniref:GGDEF domain-containing protein n=1 Tax=Acuticoccus kalidii TaxID=2910977 RepID=UPI001F2BD630|nr:GGDEF domain-containing protein [Acuticoccus kalidii]MCF3935292.1 GGDEF domain-containing protein [Acuticoccus kalidii]